MTKGYKWSITIAIFKIENNKKILEILDHRNSFKLIENHPIKKLQKATVKVLDKFRVNGYLGNVKKFYIDTNKKNKGLQLSYDLIEAHKTICLLISVIFRNFILACFDVFPIFSNILFEKVKAAIEKDGTILKTP